MGESHPAGEPSDEQLVARSLNGSERSFALLVARYQAGIAAYARRLGGAGEEEDLAQEVFLRAYRALPRFRGESPFGAWLYRIARNLCLSEIRKRKSRGDHLSWEEEGEEKVHRLLPDRGGLEQEIVSRDLARRVRALVGRLPETQASALTLFYLNGLRYEEIAEAMDAPLGTVKTYLHRGRLALRDLVVEEMGVPVEDGEEVSS